MNTPSSKYDSFAYHHPRVESIRTQTPINSPRKRTISNNNSIISRHDPDHDSIIKTSIMDESTITDDNDITPRRKSVKKNLFNSTSSTIGKETIIEDTVNSERPLFSNYPDEYTNFSRLSVESVKGSEITPMYYKYGFNTTTEDIEGEEEEVENKILTSNVLTRKSSTLSKKRNTISSRSGHFDIINEISIPSPAFHDDPRQKRIIKNRSSLVNSNEVDQIISEGKTMLDTNSFTEEIIHDASLSSETYKISEVNKERVISSILPDRSLRNTSEDFLMECSSDYDQKNIKRSKSKNLTTPKDYRDELDTLDNNSKYIKVSVYDIPDNESISIEDSISSKDEAHNKKNIPDNTSYLGIKSYKKKIKYRNNELRGTSASSSVEIIDFINRNRKNFMNRNDINSKRLSNLLRRSFQKSDNNSISLKKNLINHEENYDDDNNNEDDINDIINDNKENIFIDNDQSLMHTLPPLEFSNDIIINSIFNGRDDSEQTYYHKQNISETTLPRYNDPEDEGFQKMEIDLYRSNSNPVPRTKLNSINDYELRPVKRFYSTMQRSNPFKNIYTNNFKCSDIFEIRKSKKNITDSKYQRGNSQILYSYDQIYSPVAGHEDEDDYDRTNYYSSSSGNNDINYLDNIRRTLSPLDNYSSPKKEYMRINLSRKQSYKSNNEKSSSLLPYDIDIDTNNNTKFNTYSSTNTKTNSNCNLNIFSPDLKEQEKNRKKCQELYSASLFNSPLPFDNDKLLSSSPDQIFAPAPAIAHLKSDDNLDNKNKNIFFNNTIHRSLSRLKKKNYNNNDSVQINNVNSNFDNYHYR
ncbi:hypothetical protein BCR32DRAFT_241418 [Anaeromyces robustus]|uniref:Uncharacterized protein n=1 Tax=Anaeromyces robustus TaxID=1754192 RepID=A0A1Y1XJI7_9FUNG|nr:hypothetical protein BCR32DRAFT_241418 [Anaeromyces robustus]|eukprot:ORX85908.1 hypothetical protein BCR32DRAFT_241418 [Anaeromyces robustus]